MICEKCRKNLLSDSKYCLSCGYKIKSYVDESNEPPKIDPKYKFEFIGSSTKYNNEFKNKDYSEFKYDKNTTKNKYSKYKNNNSILFYLKWFLCFIMVIVIGVFITVGFNMIKQIPSVIPTFFQRGATDAEIRYVLKIVADAYTYQYGVEDCRQYTARFWYEMNKLGIRCDYVQNFKMNHAYNRVKLLDGSYIFVEPQAYEFGEVENYLLENLWDRIPDINVEEYRLGLSLNIDYLLTGIRNDASILVKPPSHIIYSLRN